MTAAARTVRRGLGAALAGLLTAAAFTWWPNLTAHPAGPVGSQPDVAALSDLGDDTFQHDAAQQLAAALAANPADPGKVAAACQVATQLTHPLPADTGRWVQVNCAEASQAHPGAYANNSASRRAD